MRAKKISGQKTAAKGVEGGEICFFELQIKLKNLLLKSDVDI
jgi:hypothetical protein